MTKREQIALKYARKIHWNIGRTPDAYGQEQQHRTFTLILESFTELIPPLKPHKL